MPLYKIAGIDVHFPYDAYDCQIAYMSKVIQALQKGCNALLESPTGTGKTLCLLCAALAWRESLGNALQSSFRSQMETDSLSDIEKPSLPTIMYASRTHSQLQQVIRELKACKYRPQMMILGSREQMCIHKDVSYMRGRAQNNACRSLCKSRSCFHHLRVSDYLKGHPNLGNEPVDIEDLVRIGREEGPCPYFLSRELHNKADILFAPYNYLIDKENRRSLTGIDWNNTVLIFDEAHNLESICADAASFDLSSSHLSACIAEAKQCIEIAKLRIAREGVLDKSIDPDHFAILNALLLSMEKKINEMPIQSGELGVTRPGLYIYEFLADLKITNNTATPLIDTIDHAITLLEDDANSTSVTTHAKSKVSTYRLQTLRDGLKLIFRGHDQSHASSYRVHIHENFISNTESSSNRGKGSRTLSWWCFNPGIAMEEFGRLGVRSIIVTSGTLAPLDSFAWELNLPFEVRLENPHVIGSNQIWVGVISTGPSGRSLNSSYRTRDSVEYKQELGNAIVNFARIVPDGLLVFFPSYYLLNRCVDFWQAPGKGALATSTTIWERICKHKQPVVEPKQSSLFNEANEDFLAKLKDSTSSGAVFFAVCRGKVSEGLDFADRAGRAVVVTGIPYAMKTDPKVRLKREYLDEQSRSKVSKKKTLTGEEWYVQQAARAVNQSVGRVIRHRHDYGAIILCDERFVHSNTQMQMSLWLRPYIKHYKKFGDAAFTLTRFFREKLPTSDVKNESANMPMSEGSTKECLQESIVSTSGRQNLNSSLQIMAEGGTTKNRQASIELVSESHHHDLMLQYNSEGMKDDDFQSSAPLDAMGIFGRKTVTPMFPHRESSSANTSYGSCKTLSSMVAAVREKAKSSCIDVVSPANLSTCRIDDRPSRLESCGNHSKIVIPTLAKVQESGKLPIIDLSDSPADNTYLEANRSHGLSTKRTKIFSSIDTNNIQDRAIKTQENMLNKTSDLSYENKRNYDEGPSAKTHMGHVKVNPETKLKSYSHVTSTRQETNKRLSSVEEEKSKTAAEFLTQVRAKLNDSEYRQFTDCMRGIKQKTVKMNNALQFVVRLLSSPERSSLLKRFRDFVPAQFHDLYEQYVNATS